MATKKKKNSIKNEKNKINSINSEFDFNIKRYAFVVFGVVIFICAFYFLTVYITSKNKTDSSTSTTEESTTETISYTNIMVGRSFSISDGDYYVIYYDKSDENINSECSSIVSSYNSKEDNIDIYTVDMSNGLNKKYSGSESNTNPNSASEIVINGPTLIKFSDGSVEEYIEGIDEIKNNLQ